jgi:hypothetical protein
VDSLKITTLELNVMQPGEDNMHQLNESQDTKKIISRLILQKLLAHEVCKFLNKKKYEELGHLFLSNDPDKDLRLDFIITKEDVGDRYYQGIADLTIRWLTDDLEKIDAEGNVWKNYELRMTTGINSRWSMKANELAERAECMMCLSSIISELDSLVGKQMQIQTLTSEQRIQRENQIKYTKTCDQIVQIIRWKQPELRRGLRAGGKTRGISRDPFSSIPSGSYELEINEGSNRSPRIKKYSLTIPQNPAYLATIKRIA